MLVKGWRRCTDEPLLRGFNLGQHRGNQLSQKPCRPRKGRGHSAEQNQNHRIWASGHQDPSRAGPWRARSRPVPALSRATDAAWSPKKLGQIGAGWGRLGQHGAVQSAPQLAWWLPAALLLHCFHALSGCQSTADANALELVCLLRTPLGRWRWPEPFGFADQSDLELANRTLLHTRARDTTPPQRRRSAHCCLQTSLSFNAPSAARPATERHPLAIPQDQQRAPLATAAPAPATATPARDHHRSAPASSPSDSWRRQRRRRR